MSASPPNSNFRVPPQSLDTEKALLGSLLLNADAVHEVADTVKPESFYAGQNRIVFDAMLALHEKGQPIDLITVSGKLKDLGQLADIGGSTYLSELVGSSSSPGSAKHYAEEVQNKFILRSLISARWQICGPGFSVSTQSLN